jgi:hypothetical protein
MTKLNSKLFTLFLGLGVVFFAVAIYLFFINEIIPKHSNATKHTINFNGLKIVKNDFYDSTYSRQQMLVEESMRHSETDEYFCGLFLINLKDNVSYVVSSSFSDIRQLHTPNTIDINSGQSLVPNSTLTDNYKILVKCGTSRIVADFQIGSIVDFLDLKNKKDNSTEKKEIKLVTKDNKLIAFAMFTID